MQRHLYIPQCTEHEVPARECHFIGVHTSFVLLSLGDDGVVGLSVLRVPIRILRTDPVHHTHTILLRPFDETVNPRLGYRRMIVAIAVRVADKQKLLRLQFLHGRPGDCRDRLLRRTCNCDDEPLFSTGNSHHKFCTSRLSGLDNSAWIDDPHDCGISAGEFGIGEVSLRLQ